MVDAQNWINKKDKSITSLEYIGISGNLHNKLEGSLKISNFKELKVLNLPYNKITEVEIYNCPQLREINIMGNKLTKFEYRQAHYDSDLLPKFEELDLTDNDLQDISFLKEMFPIHSSQSLKSIRLGDNKITSAAQNLSTIEDLFLTHKQLTELDLGVSENGVKKGKRNNFSGSIKKLYNAVKSYEKVFHLDISGTDLDEGLEDLLEKWKKIHLGCRSRRDGDKVKKIYDQLASLDSGGSEITIDKDGFKKLKEKAANDKAETKKWEPVKNQAQNILDKIKSSDHWQVVDLYKSLYQISTPSNDYPQEISDLFHEARMETHKIIEKFFKSDIEIKEITDQQIDIIEKKLIPFEQRLNEHMHKWGWIKEQEKKEYAKHLEEGIKSLQKERNRRANPNSNDNQGDGNQRKPVFGDNSFNLPTDKGTPPSNQQDGPSQNGPSDNSNNDKNDSGGPQKDNKPDSTDQKNQDKINQSKNIEEARENAKKILTQIFQNTSIKLNDLDSSLWGNEKSPEDYLKKLDTKEKINEFIQRLRQSIKAKEEQKNSPSSSDKNKQGEGKGALIAFVIIFVVILVVSPILIIVIRNKRTAKKKKKKRNEKDKMVI